MRWLVFLALAACSDPSKHVWIQGNLQTGRLADGYEDCPGDACLLPVLDIDGDPEEHRFVDAEGTEYPVFVSNGDPKRSPILKKDDGISVYLHDPDFVGVPSETTGERYGCTIRWEEMTCSPDVDTDEGGGDGGYTYSYSYSYGYTPEAPPGVIPRYFLRATAIQPREIVEGNPSD